MTVLREVVTVELVNRLDSHRFPVNQGRFFTVAGGRALLQDFETEHEGGP